MHGWSRGAGRRNRWLALAAGVTTLTLLAGCTSSTTGTAVADPSVGASAVATSVSNSPSPVSTSGAVTQPDGPTAGSTATSPTMSAGAGSTSAGGIPAGLAKYYEQQLDWGGCVDFASTDADRKLYAQSGFQCTQVTVPLAYDDPAGKTISIAVLRKQASDQANRIGSLQLNPGGPGASGVEFAADLAGSATGKRLNRRFDLIGFDPRGVGSSTPAVQCQTGPEWDAIRATDRRSRTAAEVAAANSVSKRVVQLCVDRTGSDAGIDGKKFLANIGTRDASHDMDLLRAALGDDQLTFLGASYGTRLGYTYAEQFPARVRAMVLDGVVAPDDDSSQTAIVQAAAFQDAFEVFASWCTTKVASCVFGADPARATEIFQHLVRPLLGDPLPVTGGRKLSFSDAVIGTSRALYSEELWKYLATGLLNLSRGSGDLLMALADDYSQRDTSGQYSNMLQAFDAVRCMDGPALTEPAAITAFNAKFNAAAPYQDSADPAGPVADICAFWPVPPTTTPHQLDIPGIPTLLVVSTKGDPATPYQNGVEVAEQLGAALLTVNGTRHTAVAAGIPCVDTAVVSYLETLATPPAGTVCG